MFTYLSVDGHLSCLHFLAIMNNAAIHTSFNIDFGEKMDQLSYPIISHYESVWLLVVSLNLLLPPLYFL